MATFSPNQKFSSSQDDFISESKKSKNLKNVRLIQTNDKETQDYSSYPIESLSRDDEILAHQSDDETNYESNGSSSPINADLRPSSSFISSFDDFIPTGLSTEVELDGPEREFFMRTVVIGTQNAGKSSLINSCFANTEDGSAQNPQERPQVDLLMKAATNFNDTKKYHFWMRTLHRDDSEIKEILWKTYYKWANTFVFVYDITSQESFKALERAVKAVQRVIPKDKFFGILVGTKSDLPADQRAVTSEEALEFKQAYNFMYFIETSSAAEETTPQLLPRLDTKLKLTFEAI